MLPRAGLKRWALTSCLAVGVSLGFSGANADQSQDPLTLVERLTQDPAALRSDWIKSELKSADIVSLAPIMRLIATDPSRDWDVRARALTFLTETEDQAAVTAFSSHFEPVAVANDRWGADTFEILAKWASRSPAGKTTAAPLLLSPEKPEAVDAVLIALAGNGIPTYLRYLDEHGYSFQTTTITALGKTDDQLTRQFLSWWVGEHRPPGMASFLLDQIVSPYQSSYRTQVDRVFVALFTAGIGELIRSAVPTPRWLKDDATPKGIALESLGRYYPEGTTISDPEVVDTLLTAAATNAPGQDRGQWQLAVDILFFLHNRHVPLAGLADQVAADLVRQVLRKRGPLEPFIAVAELNHRAGLAFPSLSADEKPKVWVVASKTLNAAFLKAVVDHLPDKLQRAALEQRLLGLGGQAARGSLRLVRCWGADIETPGDWATAVAALGLVEAIDDVEGVLDTSWPEQAVEALILFGAPGAPALGRFLLDPTAQQVDSAVRAQAIQSCALHLPEDEWQSLLAHLENDPALVDAGTTTIP